MHLDNVSRSSCISSQSGTWCTCPPSQPRCRPSACNLDCRSEHSWEATCDSNATKKHHQPKEHIPKKIHVTLKQFCLSSPPSVKFYISAVLALFAVTLCSCHAIPYRSLGSVWELPWTYLSSLIIMCSLYPCTCTCLILFLSLWKPLLCCTPTHPYPFHSARFVLKNDMSCMFFTPHDWLSCYYVWKCKYTIHWS